MKKILKVLIITFLFTTFCTMVKVEASTNKTYSEAVNMQAQIDEGLDDQNDSSLIGTVGWSIARLALDTILEYLTKFIFSVAGMIEGLVKNFCGKIFGVPVFPWADLIVFNCLPYLDVNFFAYDTNAIFEVGSFDSIIRNVYYSLLIMSVSVIGIGVAITAIRLAASTIAADKAKYKEAITRCVYAVVMLLSLHFVLSFLFYMNEQVVIAASNILINSTDDFEFPPTSVSKEALSSWVSASAYGVAGQALTWDISNYTSNIGNVVSGWFGGGGKARVQEVINKYGDACSLAMDKGLSIETPSKIGCYLLSNSDYYKYRWQDYLWTSNSSMASSLLNYDYVLKSNFGVAGATDTEVARSAYALVWDIYNIIKADNEEQLHDLYYDSGIYTHDTALDQDKLDSGKKHAYKVVKAAYQEIVLGQSTQVDVMSSLAKLFKEGSYGSLDDKTDYDPISTLLYAILMIQSLMLLINYIKRIFYVLVLSIIGPIVVVYDFVLGSINSKNKVFNVWIKELCSLIFVQAFQALLMALMLSIVVNLYHDAITTGDSGSRNAMGIYAVIILVLIPKVELLVKRIFGLGSGVMNDSMIAGRDSLLKTGLALKLGGRVLNNAGKTIGGLAGLASTFPGGMARKKVRIAENNYNASLNRSNNNLALGNSEPDGERQNAGRGIASVGRNYSINDSNSRNGRLGTSSAGSLGNLTADDLASAIKKANDDSPEDALNKAKHELTQQRLNSLHKAASGVTETIGAIGGAGLGAVVSLGTGGDDLISDMMIGMGVGDKVGEAAANATIGNATRINENSYQRKKLNDKLRKSEDKLRESRNINNSQAVYNAVVREAASRNNTSSNGASPSVSQNKPKTRTLKNVKPVSEKIKQQKKEYENARNKVVSNIEVRNNVASSNNVHKDSQLKEINAQIKSDKRELASKNKSYNESRAKIQRAVSGKATTGNYKMASRTINQNNTSNLNNSTSTGSTNMNSINNVDDLN